LGAEPKDGGRFFVSTYPRRVANRQAFTLVETLVALVIFQFAMLALALGAAVAARDLMVARRLTMAHTMARNRVERLASLSCPAVGRGALQTKPFIEYWRVDAVADRRTVSDSVVFPRPNGTLGVAVARATTLCTR
jgi:Tfp pilus assembly protein PilV